MKKPVTQQNNQRGIADANDTIAKTTGTSKFQPSSWTPLLSVEETGHVSDGTALSLSQHPRSVYDFPSYMIDTHEMNVSKIGQHKQAIALNTQHTTNYWNYATNQSGE